MFTAREYNLISRIVFRDNYPGYTPNIVESPNGDGNWDAEKRYAHIAKKYLDQCKADKMTMNDYCYLMEMFDRAHVKATEIAIDLGVPRAFWPDHRYSAMRILEYPAGAITHTHVDFDLFTLMCYRNIPSDFEYVGDYDCAGLAHANTFNKQIHFGEILEIILPSMKATPHQVVADPNGRSQYSIVYFTIPDEAAVLPTGETVGQWIAERKGRSRKAA